MSEKTRGVRVAWSPTAAIQWRADSATLTRSQRLGVFLTFLREVPIRVNAPRASAPHARPAQRWRSLSRVCRRQQRDLAVLEPCDADQRWVIRIAEPRNDLDITCFKHLDRLLLVPSLLCSVTFLLCALCGLTPLFFLVTRTRLRSFSVVSLLCSASSFVALFDGRVSVLADFECVRQQMEPAGAEG
jgi:hypothetical protein